MEVQELQIPAFGVTIERSLPDDCLCGGRYFRNGSTRRRDTNMRTLSHPTMPSGSSQSAQTNKKQNTGDKRQKEWRWRAGGGGECWARGMPFSVYKQKGVRRERHRKCHPFSLSSLGVVSSPGPCLKGRGTHPLRICPLQPHLLGRFFKGRLEFATSTEILWVVSARFSCGSRKESCCRNFSNDVLGIFALIDRNKAAGLVANMTGSVLVVSLHFFLSFLRHYMTIYTSAVSRSDMRFEN